METGSGNPFTIPEATISVLLGVDRKWIGACAEDLTLAKEIEATQLEYPGLPYRKVKQGAESHTIEIANVWLADTEVTPPAMPELARGESYTMVIVWFDEETGCFAKRTYFGVTAATERIRVPGQNLTFRAERMAQLAGCAEEPDLAPLEEP